MRLHLKNFWNHHPFDSIQCTTVRITEKITLTYETCLFGLVLNRFNIALASNCADHVCVSATAILTAVTAVKAASSVQLNCVLHLSETHRDITMHGASRVVVGGNTSHLTSGTGGVLTATITHRLAGVTVFLIKTSQPFHSHSLLSLQQS